MRVPSAAEAILVVFRNKPGLLASTIGRNRPIALLRKEKTHNLKQSKTPSPLPHQSCHDAKHIEIAASTQRDQARTSQSSRS